MSRGYARHIRGTSPLTRIDQGSRKTLYDLVVRATQTNLADKRRDDGWVGAVVAGQQVERLRQM
jgi:hypothetical protein